MIRCTLCGRRYDEKEAQTACGCCSISKGCKLIRCPNCGFETPPEPPSLLGPVLFFLRKIGVGGKIRSEGKNRTGPDLHESPLLLPKLPIGNAAEIVALLTVNPAKLQKLMAMGLFPGTKITLIQNFPSYVFQAGHSQFVIDHELAEGVLCQLSF